MNNWSVRDKQVIINIIGKKQNIEHKDTCSCLGGFPSDKDKIILPKITEPEDIYI